MPDYKKMYQLIFQATEYAVRQLEADDLLGAVHTIKNAQLQCEDIFIESSLSEDKTDD